MLPEEGISRKEWREIEEIEREMKRGEYVSLEEFERPTDVRVDKRNNRRSLEKPRESKGPRLVARAGYTDSLKA